MESAGTRIRQSRKASKISQSDLARRVGVSQASIAYWENDANAPAGANLLALASALRVSPDWILTGREGGRIESLNTWAAGENDEQAIDLPYYREIQFAAGSGRTSAVEQAAESLRFSRQILREAGVDPDHAACATNCGDSMADKILDGAGIGIDRSKTQIKDGKIYAIDHDGLLRVKYLHRLPGGGIRLRSHNKDGYPDEDYSAEYAAAHIVILGWVFWWSSVDRW